MAEQDPIMGAIAQAAVEQPPETDEGKQLLNDFTSAEQQVQIDKASGFYNLAQDLDPALALEVAQEIKKGYMDDDASRADWLDMHEFWLRLYMQTDYALNADQERDWGSTESVPILTEACDQFQSRTYKAFFPSDKFISAIPQQHTNDPIKRQMMFDRADRVGRHMSWQLGTQNKNYKRDKRALFLGTAIHGSFFTKTYFDAYKKKRACVDNVRPTDLVINYTYGPKCIDDVRRKSHIIPITVGESQTLAAKGWLTQAAMANDGQSQTQYDTAVDESQGLTPGSSTLRSDRAATLIEQQFWLDLDDRGYPVPYLGTIDWPSGKLLRLVIDYEADPQGNPMKDYEQIQYYTHYKYMENPDGFYGLGLGHKIGDLNSAVNIGVRQMLDASTLATQGNCSGFISSRLCMDGEDDVTMTLGKFKKTPDNAGDISSGIKFMQFGGPNEAQMKLIEALDQRAQRMGATTDATTGSIDKNMQPTTVLAQIEQALEQFSSVQTALKDDFNDELAKIYRINAKHLPFVEYFMINDVSDVITRQDYQEDMLVTAMFDPKFSTRAQKVAKAQAELDATLKNPLSQSRPQVFDIAFRNYLEALECDNIDELIPPTPLEQAVNAIQQAQQQQGQAAPPVPGAASPMGNGRNNAMGAAAAPAGPPTPGGPVPPQIPGAGGGSQPLVGGA